MSALRISQLSSATGVPATTLRFYEREGLLPADRSPNGYRVYDDRAQQRLAFITAAKSLNLSLPEIKLLLRVWEKDSCAAVKAELTPAIESHISRANESIAQMTALRDSLTDARARLDDTPDASTPCNPDCTWLISTTAAVGTA
ncbi:MerR family transcriptional regulator [Rhodococcus sp. 14-2686-1-2]|nr:MULTISPECIES: MerR family transcriptional regulator [unclassified Rhodococcus (in: high G+C Gram-positive bacteria)]OZE92938.1 MerR family transcriptional regulator [Rhodococcus sp. 15-1189-1-1a]OZF08192.1 MerR family transcriptional regulator [Rhodococcus sp. 14-2686-1-2]